jgi:phage terminase large subunit GpA-like protein
MRVIVTDHALLRYIERVCGVDLVKLREIIAEEVRVPAKVGATTVTINGYVYCLVERDSDVAVTTILDPSMRANRHKRHHRRGIYKDASNG